MTHFVSVGANKPLKASIKLKVMIQDGPTEALEHINGINYNFSIMGSQNYITVPRIWL